MSRLITLHAAFRHEYRDVQQYAEVCNGATLDEGDCHYCNNPDEMDAYLFEIESGLTELARLSQAALDNDAAAMGELRRSYRAAVHALARAAGSTAGRSPEQIQRAHRPRLDPWAQ